MRGGKTGVFVIFFVAAFFLLITSVQAETDLKPRVPAAKLAKVKEMANPIPAEKKTVPAGEAVFKKGQCFNCHGISGKGDGTAGAAFNPKPRNFTDTQWQEARTDGEIFWAISEGTDYGMIPFGAVLSDDERWHLVSYIRYLGKAKAENTVK